MGTVLGTARKCRMKLAIQQWADTAERATRIRCPPDCPYPWLDGPDTPTADFTRTGHLPIARCARRGTP